MEKIANASRDDGFPPEPISHRHVIPALTDHLEHYGGVIGAEIDGQFGGFFKYLQQPKFLKFPWNIWMNAAFGVPSAISFTNSKAVSQGRNALASQDNGGGHQYLRQEMNNSRCDNDQDQQDCENDPKLAHFRSQRPQFSSAS